MEAAQNPKRPRSATLILLVLWVAFYASFALFRPALLDDADSVHAEVAREMLLRHDPVTLYANGIRYLEKAPLLYWSMAASMAVVQMLGHGSARCLAVAARIPLALTVLALAFAVEAFGRRAFRSARAGLYAALILLSSPGIFLFTRILLPDAMLCLWLTLAMVCFWLTEAREQGSQSREEGSGNRERGSRRAQETVILSEARSAKSKDLLLYSAMFAACCALGVLTKGLIGVVFPVGIVAVYLLLTRGLRGAFARIRQLHPLASTLVFLAIAAPWHIAIALANPTQGHPGSLAFSLHSSPHWSVPLPSDGNVHGWAWFYFINEQVLRYLNLRVPHDYDTVPLWLFWGLCLIWLMPWSAFAFKALGYAIRSALSIRPTSANRTGKRWNTTMGESRNSDADRAVNAASVKGTASAVPSANAGEDAASAAEVTACGRTGLLLLLWAALPLVFFSFSTRQEYYVLPSLPAFAILIASWLAQDSVGNWTPITDKAKQIRRANLRCTGVLAALGGIFAAASIFFLLHTRKPAPNADLATLLQQNPQDYAMSMGHFLDLNAAALSLFRLPLALAAASLFLGPGVSYLLRRRARAHAATLTLAAGAFGFLLAVHMGYATFAPVLSSAQLAYAMSPQLADDPNALVVIHQEYEYGSTLGFYLQRPSYRFVAVRESPPQTAPPTDHDTARIGLRAVAVNPVQILTDAGYKPTEQVPGSPYGRSSNLWYGSFFADAPPIFETTASLAAKWHSPRRIFLWQDLAGEPGPLPAALSPAYVIARSGGKEIVSNEPNP